MDCFSLRFLKEEDLNQVVKIDKERFSFSPFNENDFARTLKKGELKTIVLLKDKVIVGYIMVSFLLDEGEIYRIAVTQKEEGMGYGKMLLDEGESFLKKKDVKTCLLEVSTNNKRAYNFYTKDGFTTYRIRKEYYSNKEDAYCMKKGL